jgi:hypothetical protein
LQMRTSNRTYRLEQLTVKLIVPMSSSYPAHSGDCRVGESGHGVEIYEECEV